jgi:hypothetical protein
MVFTKKVILLCELQPWFDRYRVGARFGIVNSESYTFSKKCCILYKIRGSYLFEDFPLVALAFAYCTSINFGKVESASVHNEYGDAVNVVFGRL